MLRLISSNLSGSSSISYRKSEQLMLISIPRVIAILNFENVANDVRIVRPGFWPEQVGISKAVSF
jgi:hypothetical protein